MKSLQKIQDLKNLKERKKLKKLKELFSVDYLAKYKIVDWSYFEDSQACSYDKFEEWLQKKNSNILNYLTGDRALKRLDLKNVCPEFESGIVFLFSYRDEKYVLQKLIKARNSFFKIASYVFGFNGLDYHICLRETLDQIADDIKDTIYINNIKDGDIDLQYQLSLDVHPVLERDLAYRAGLGFFGKNSMLISKKHGSYTIIGSIFFNQRLSSEKSNVREPELDHCGNCTKCIDACPTNAIDVKTRTLIASKCISYYTIEQFKDDLSRPVPIGFNTSSEKYIFGCDICQDVCPWNIKLLKNIEPCNKLSELKESFLKYPIFQFILDCSKQSVIDFVQKCSNKEFKKIFFQTSFFRSGKRGVLKNLLKF